MNAKEWELIKAQRDLSFLRHDARPSAEGEREALRVKIHAMLEEKEKNGDV